MSEALILIQEWIAPLLGPPRWVTTRYHRTWYAFTSLRFSWGKFGRGTLSISGTTSGTQPAVLLKWFGLVSKSATLRSIGCSRTDWTNPHPESAYLSDFKLCEFMAATQCQETVDTWNLFDYVWLLLQSWRTGATPKPTCSINQIKITAQGVRYWWWTWTWCPRDRHIDSILGIFTRHELQLGNWWPTWMMLPNLNESSTNKPSFCTERDVVAQEVVTPTYTEFASWMYALLPRYSGDSAPVGHWQSGEGAVPCDLCHWWRMAWFWLIRDLQTAENTTSSIYIA